LFMVRVTRSNHLLSNLLLSANCILFLLLLIFLLLIFICKVLFLLHCFINRLLVGVTAYSTGGRRHVPSSLFYSLRTSCSSPSALSLLHSSHVLFLFFLTLYFVLFCYTHALHVISSLSSTILVISSVVVLTFILILFIIVRLVYSYCIRVRPLQKPLSLPCFLHPFYYLFVPFLFFLLLNLLLITLSFTFVAVFFYPRFSIPSISHSLQSPLIFSAPVGPLAPRIVPGLRLSHPTDPPLIAVSNLSVTPLSSYHPLPCPSVCPSLNHVPCSLLFFHNIAVSLSNIPRSRHHRLLFFSACSVVFIFLILSPVVVLGTRKTLNPS